MRFSRVLAVSGSAVGLLATIGGCSSDAISSSQHDVRLEAPPGEYDLTIVRLGNGAPVVTHRRVSAESEARAKAERVARERKMSGSTENGLGKSTSALTDETITEDGSCSGSSLWVYDQPNRTGNRLCLMGWGRYDLTTLCRTWQWVDFGFYSGWMCTANWATATTSAVRSYWPGNQDGSVVGAAPNGPYSTAPIEASPRCADQCSSWAVWGGAVDNVSCGANGRFIEQHVYGRSCWASSSAYFALGDSPKNDSYNWSHNCQGLATSNTNWYALRMHAWWLGESSTNFFIYSTSKSGNLSQDLVTSRGYYTGGWNHQGDPDWYKSVILVPLEQPPGGGAGTAVGLVDGWLSSSRMMIHTLSGPGGVSPDSSPWVAVNPRDGLMYTSRYGDTPRFELPVTALSVYEANITDGSIDGASFPYRKQIQLRDELGYNKELSRVQGGAFSKNGHLYLVSWDSDPARAGVYGFDVVTGRQQMFIQLPYTGTEELEGITVDPATWYDNGHIHVNMWDNTYDNIWVKHIYLSTSLERL